jgi:hypothetical protein
VTGVVALAVGLLWLAVGAAVGLLVGRVVKHRDQQIPTHVTRTERLEARQIRARCACQWRGPIRRDLDEVIADGARHDAATAPSAS